MHSSRHVQALGNASSIFAEMSVTGEHFSTGSPVCIFGDVSVACISMLAVVKVRRNCKAGSR